jgi:diaminopimelate epimerase
MKFTKMHGLGNDFIMVHSDRTPVLEEVSRLAVAMCNRHTGVGADGLVWMFPSKLADIATRHFNADGTLAEQCGNAVRCVAKYFYEYVSNEKTEITIETKVGVQPVWLETEKGRVRHVRVDMGEPVLTPHAIPVAVDGKTVVNREIEAGGRMFRFTAVSMGNPHAVIEVALTFPLEKWGPLLETHPFFPNKTNVEFITVHSAKEITMRVWERGVGPTLACGSGACASVVAAVLTGRASRSAVVHLAGGDLFIEWNEQDNRVYMTGPAAVVFEGEWFGEA